MKIYAIGDLHLSFNEAGEETKPMAVFGKAWENHWQKIKNNWLSSIKAEDVILLPGDISWALQLEEAIPDFLELSRLPGTKVFIKGNHDLWWQSLKKIRKILPEELVFIQNNHYSLGDRVAIAGTRGWLMPGDVGFSGHDQKIYRREVGRLRLSLQSVPDNCREIIAVFHFPPINSKQEENELTDLLQEFGVKKCVYAHLHGHSLQGALRGEKWGIEFILASADGIGFSPIIIKDLELG